MDSAGEESDHRMPECNDLRLLRQAAGKASLRCRALLEESTRLPVITGLSQQQILDSILRAMETRQVSCAALHDHAVGHDQGLRPCGWPYRCIKCTLPRPKTSY